MSSVNITCWNKIDDNILLEGNGIKITFLYKTRFVYIRADLNKVRKEDIDGKVMGFKSHVEHYCVNNEYRDRKELCDKYMANLKNCKRKHPNEYVYLITVNGPNDEIIINALEAAFGHPTNNVDAVEIYDTYDVGMIMTDKLCDNNNASFLYLN